MSDNNDLKGLGGWLILVGIGVVISPFRLLATLVPTYLPIFEDGTWEALTTEGSEYYTQYFDYLLIGEIFFNGLMILSSLALIYLYFSKHYFFPKLYIIIITASLVFIPLDAWLVTLIFPSEEMFDMETLREFGRTLIAGLIWVPYMLVSQRVKLTFTNGRNENSQPQVEAGTD
ncbi:MAG: DUF2569 domain-containing protein [Gammaproteobacteria bacterium]|nr:DUF2569 domain-containing protein [Gammaproteobacteria bacterium]